MTRDRNRADRNADREQSFSMTERTRLATANLNASGVATFSTASLTAGTHSLTAQYSGDAINATATSNAVNEVINQATTTTTISTSAGSGSGGNDCHLYGDSDRKQHRCSDG